MAMERLERILRQTGAPRDEVIADGIEAFRKLRGKDIPIGIYLGMEEISEPRSTRTTRKTLLYQQAADIIRQRILSGEFANSDKLPSESLFLQQLKESGIDISRLTLR